MMLLRNVLFMNRLDIEPRILVPKVIRDDNRYMIEEEGMPHD